VNINKKLNLEKLDSFLKLLENLDFSKFEQGNSEKGKKKKQKSTEEEGESPSKLPTER